MSRCAFAVIVLTFAAAAVAQPDRYKPIQTRATGIEVLARLSVEPRHVNVLTDGRIIFSVTPETRKTIAVAELLPNGAIQPFPSKDWAMKPSGGNTGMVNVAAIALDAPSGYVVILDIGDNKTPGKVLVWDTKNNKPFKVVQLPRARLSNYRFVQDLALDLKRKCIYLVGHDMEKKSAAIIVVDFAGEKVRPIGLRRLAPGSIPMGTQVTSKTVSSVLEGFNTPIVIDPAYEWVYLAGQGGSDIFRVKADDLANPNLTADQLMEKLQDYGQKELATSIAADEKGNVYVCEGSNSQIGRYSPDRKYRVWVQDAGLNWPDDISLGPDGYAYITVNHLRRLGLGGESTGQKELPFMIVRAKLPQTQ